MAENVLVFRVGIAHYALDTARVLYIERAPGFSPVPLAPAYVRGVCALRGEVMPLIDLAALLSLDHEGEYRCALAVGRRGEAFSLLCDDVMETRSAAGALKRAGAVGTYVAALFDDGVAALDFDALTDAILHGMGGARDG